MKRRVERSRVGNLKKLFYKNKFFLENIGEILVFVNLLKIGRIRKIMKNCRTDGF